MLTQLRCPKSPASAVNLAALYVACYAIATMLSGVDYLYASLISIIMMYAMAFYALNIRTALSLAFVYLQIVAIALSVLSIVVYLLDAYSITNQNLYSTTVYVYNNINDCLIALDIAVLASMIVSDYRRRDSVN